jgi:hypothetical protein
VAPQRPHQAPRARASSSRTRAGLTPGRLPRRAGGTHPWIRIREGATAPVRCRSRSPVRCRGAFLEVFLRPSRGCRSGAAPRRSNAVGGRRSDAVAESLLAGDRRRSDAVLCRSNAARDRRSDAVAESPLAGDRRRSDAVICRSDAVGDRRSDAVAKSPLTGERRRSDAAVRRSDAVPTSPTAGRTPRPGRSDAVRKSA